MLPDAAGRQAQLAIGEAELQPVVADEHARCRSGRVDFRAVDDAHPGRAVASAQVTFDDPLVFLHPLDSLLENRDELVGRRIGFVAVVGVYSPHQCLVGVLVNRFVKLSIVTNLGDFHSCLLSSALLSGNTNPLHRMTAVENQVDLGG